jgi:hypothetical protein
MALRKNRDRSLSHLPGLCPEPGIECRLAAASLRPGKNDSQARLVQQLNHGLTQFGKEAVDEACRHELYGLRQ